MKKELSRIEILKEKIDQQKIAMNLFGKKEGDFFFLDSLTSKEKLLKADEVAYKNITMRCKRNNNEENEACKKFDLLVHDFLNPHFNDISFFVFSKNVYEVTVLQSIFLNIYPRLKKTMNYHDIMIHNKDLSLGLCLLFDEHYISISQWNNYNS